MKITLVPSSVTERTRDQHQYLTTFLINDNIAIDAGCLGLMGTAQDQARIQHVFLTHAHIDHIGSLPVFVENVYEEGSYSVTIHGSGHLLQFLESDIFLAPLHSAYVLRIRFRLLGQLLQRQSLRFAHPADISVLDDTSLAGRNRYERCMELTHRNAEAALNASVAWQNAGGGPAAAHCAALALVALQFHRWSKLSSGSIFSPEFPRPVVALFNWGFGAIVLLALLPAKTPSHWTLNMRSGAMPLVEV